MCSGCRCSEYVTIWPTYRIFYRAPIHLCRYPAVHPKTEVREFHPDTTVCMRRRWKIIRKYHVLFKRFCEKKKIKKKENEKPKKKKPNEIETDPSLTSGRLPIPNTVRNIMQYTECISDNENERYVPHPFGFRRCGLPLLCCV